MIRRSPTRIELKLEDLSDFDYIQKFDKKKGSNAVPGTVGGISAADAQKFMRQDRIGFRPIMGGAPSAGGNGTSGYTSATNNGGGAVSVDVIPGVASTSEITTSAIDDEGVDGVEGPTTPGGGGGANRSSNVADMDISGDDREAVTPSNAVNVDMSLDESL